MAHLDVIRAPQLWILLILGLAWYAYRRIRNGKSVKTALQPLPATETKEAEYSEDAYYQIEPLAGFDLERTEPIKLRPFKPTYYLTMAIQNTTMSDLIATDNTYVPRVTLRKQLIETRQHDVLAYNPVIEPAVHEFYSWLISTYLPSRHPTLFTLTNTGLQNHVTRETLPLTPSNTVSALQIMGENIDTDFLFLLPIPDSEGAEDAGKYRLEGFITCFPSGFQTAKKLGLKLADIHGPVPNYKEKLEKSMDRFFAMLPVGRIIKRHNWSVTTTRELCLLGGTHLTPEEVARRKERELQDGGGEEEAVDIDQTVLRCERQTLHRLPKSKAIVFGYKTYQYGLRELKEEGCGKEMADAIEGLGKGNAPGMTSYKRQVVWGKTIVDFLRSED